MRILEIGNFGRGWDGSICDEEHIAKALEDLGHQVLRGQRNDLGGEGWTNIDFVLIAQWDGYHETFPKYLRYLNCPIVYWSFDYQADGQKWHENLVHEADLYLSKRIADAKYANWCWLSQDFSPDFLDKYPGESRKDIEVLFTGSYLPWAQERNETLKAVDDKFNLVIHSVNEWPGFKDVRPPIMDEGLPELYSRAKVILSIDHTIEAGYWSDRNAQIMACEGLVLTRYVPMMETRFKDKVEYFYDKEDCLEKIGHLLNSEAERKMKGSIGYTHAQENLMVKHRVKDLLTIVGSIL